MIISNESKEIVQIDRFKVLELLDNSSSKTLYHVVDTQKTSNEYLLLLYNNPLNIECINEKLRILKILNSSKLFLDTYLSKKVLNKYFVLIQYPSSGTLYERIISKAFTEIEACKVIINLLDILEFFNKNKIINFNLKAERIALENERCYIVDYDLFMDDSTTKYKTKEKKNSFDSLATLLYLMLTQKYIQELDASAVELKVSLKMKNLIFKMSENSCESRKKIKELREIISTII